MFFAGKQFSNGTIDDDLFQDNFFAHLIVKLFYIIHIFGTIQHPLLAHGTLPDFHFHLVVFLSFYS